jgi:hypothetical protein
LHPCKSKEQDPGQVPATNPVEKSRFPRSTTCREKFAKFFHQVLIKCRFIRGSLVSRVKCMKN